MSREVGKRSASRYRCWQFSVRAILVLVLVNGLGLAALSRPELKGRAERELLSVDLWLTRPVLSTGAYSPERVDAELDHGRTVVVHFFADWDLDTVVQRRVIDSTDALYFLRREDTTLLKCDCTESSAVCAYASRQLGVHPSTIAVFRPGAEALRASSVAELQRAVGGADPFRDAGFLAFCAAVLAVVEVSILLGATFLLHTRAGVAH